jgi:hypothetical protein
MTPEMNTSSLIPGPLSAIAWVALSCSCYVGGGFGPTYPVGAPAPAKAGANTAFEVGLTYDYHRLVRVMYLVSGQQFGGAVFTADGQHVVAPLEAALGVDVTTLRLGRDFLLRATARGYYGSGVRVGPMDHEVRQPGSTALGGLFGATLHLASTPETEEGLGPTGLSLTIGALWARADGLPMGRQVFIAPMILFATEFSPPHVLYCWFVNEKCPHFLRPVKN